MGAEPVLRGQVWLADVGLDDPKRFVIVSNNERNRRSRDVLGVRMTTAQEPSIPSVVESRPGDAGEARTYAVADDIVPLAKEDLVRPVGGLTRAQMSRIEGAIEAALALG